MTTTDTIAGDVETESGPDRSPYVAVPDSPFPFPVNPAEGPLACVSERDLFHPASFSTLEARKNAEVAKKLCAACPIATGCLKWALANPRETQGGIWAGTTPSARAKLRRDLVARLGKNWAEVVAAKDRARIRQRRTPQPNSGPRRLRSVARPHGSTAVVSTPAGSRPAPTAALAPVVA
jgi:Transcription factor WhiB